MKNKKIVGKPKKSVAFWQILLLVAIGGGFYLFWDFLQRKTEVDKGSSALYKEGFAKYNHRFLNKKDV